MMEQPELSQKEVSQLTPPTIISFGVSQCPDCELWHMGCGRNKIEWQHPKGFLTEEEALEEIVIIRDFILAAERLALGGGV